MAATRESAMSIINVMAGINRDLNAEEYLSSLEEKYVDEVIEAGISIDANGGVTKTEASRTILYDDLINDLGQSFNIEGLSNAFDDQGNIRTSGVLDVISEKYSEEFNKQRQDRINQEALETLENIEEPKRTAEDIQKNIEEIQQRKIEKEAKQHYTVNRIKRPSGVFNANGEEFIEETTVYNVDKKAAEKALAEDAKMREAFVKEGYTIGLDDIEREAYNNPSRLKNNKEFVNLMEKTKKHNADGIFMDHVKKGAIKDNDLLFRVDLDDSQIRKIYSDVNSEEFIYNGAKEKFESGGYQKTFGFGKTDDKGKYLWDELSSDQQDALIKHYNDNEIKSFNDTFSGEKTSGMWPFKKKTELTGEMDLKAARQRYIRKQGFTPNEKQYNKNFNKLFEQDAQLASAYRDYYSKAKSIYDAGKSTAVPTMDEFFSDGKRILTTDQIESLKSVIGDGMGKSGIKAATKFKGLKVAGAIAAGMTALWGLSEMYDED